MDEPYGQVKEFHLRFSHPIASTPTKLTPERADKRAAWMDEELREFRGAHDVTDQADAMIDLIYFALGSLVEMGVNPSPLFAIVQAANMSKLWEDGKPRYHPDGKIAKPPTWQDPAPLLAAEIARQVTPTPAEPLARELRALARALGIPEGAASKDVLGEALIRIHEIERRAAAVPPRDV